MSAVHLTVAERHRLAALLGMLGSNQSGERDNAARFVEQFRRQHGLSWADILSTTEQAAPAPEPPPRPATPFEADVARFHEAGKAAYPDWKKWCRDLIERGCDVELSALLIARPDGVRLVAALAADPKSLAAIARLKTTAARSVALAKFAASLAGRAPHDKRAGSWIFVGAFGAFWLIVLGATFGPNTYQPAPHGLYAPPPSHHIEAPMKAAAPPPPHQLGGTKARPAGSASYPAAGSWSPPAR